MFSKTYYQKLWDLSRKIYSGVYRLQLLPDKILIGDKHIVPLLGNGSKTQKAYEAHSQRSAWVLRSWSNGGHRYHGIEYKGVGFKGGRIVEKTDLPGWPWGGMWLENALAEYELAEKFKKMGLVCESAIAVYEAGTLNGKKLGVIVRAMLSPLRISDLYKHPGLFGRYLKLRKQTRGQYFDFLAKRLAHNMSVILDNNIFYHSVALNNITTEGELVDFEPLSPQEDALSTEDKFVKMMSGMTLVGDLCGDYTSQFLQTFFNKLLSQKTRSRYQLDQLIALDRIIRLYKFRG